MNRVFGRTIVPPQVAQFEFREKKLKQMFGLKDKFDVYQENKERYEAERAPVVMTPSLVFVEKRPSNSNRFLPIAERYVRNRPEVLSNAKANYSRRGVTLQRYPISTRLDNFNINDAIAADKGRELKR